MTTVTLKDGRTIALRRATTADAGPLVALMDRCFRERVYFHKPSYDLTPEQQAKRMAHEIIVVAETADGQLVGWCEVSPGYAEFLKHEASMAIGIDQEYRGAGLGSHLLTAILAAAQEAGLERVSLHVNASNERAIRAYEKAGFIYEGRHVRQIKDGDRYDDVVVMALLFPSRHD